MTTSFCASLMPVHLDHLHIALATVEAGGIGLLDLELCPREKTGKAAENIQSLLNALENRGTIGLRLDIHQLSRFSELIEMVSSYSHWIVLCGWSPEDLSDCLKELKQSNRQIFLEILKESEIEATRSNPDFSGYMARGAECGGRCGRDSAFILCQMLAQQQRPFWVQGGIGIATAAACRVAGASGVVLDDSLLLMPESPLPLSWRLILERSGMEDTVTVTCPDDFSCRIMNRPEFPAAHRLAQHTAESKGDAWKKTIHEHVGWDDPERRVWPVGQMVGMASKLAKRYRSTGKFVRAVMEQSKKQVLETGQRSLLDAGSPLAISHGTKYPIVQGPMSRVSDCAAFASTVADRGALPFLALGQMGGADVGKMLEAAGEELGDHAWGVGLLGFLSPELQKEQFEVLERFRPPFALISGGRPDQAGKLESLGITTYLHVPTPRLLRMFLEQGARRFIFEGGECGGHVGPLLGFPYWENILDMFLNETEGIAYDEVHILFAGGIHDARSAAMVAAMAGPLSRLGIKSGLQLGTAYLLTEEAVTSGAITAQFQKQALSCRQTVTLETRPGHVIRCAPTPYFQCYNRKKHDPEVARLSGNERADALELFIRGRSRLAAKGVEHTGGDLITKDDTYQYANGLFMMGELITLKRSVVSCAALHEDVAVGGLRVISEAVKKERSPLQEPGGRSGKVRLQEPVAIVGIGCVLPGARDPESFWTNVLRQNSPIREIPPDRWDWRLYYDSNAGVSDKIYAQWGGFVDKLAFDPLSFGIPPNSLSAISINQLMALEVTRRALADAGFADGIESKNLREKTAVFFGASNTADLQQLYTTRSVLPLCVNAGKQDALDRLPQWTEESNTGILLNIISGRVANRFNLCGPNLVVDAACASSFAALDLAVRELDSNRSDMVIAGGVDFEQTPLAYMSFSKINVLSPDGCARTFDTDANGIVISEGAVVLVLKRLADAKRDGDRIHALIRGVAGSSDGKGYGITAPSSAGQQRSITKAMYHADIDPATVGLYEAHGTGTKVGDQTELETINNILRSAGADPATCAIGSVKSLLGHTRAAAGMVGLLKATLALSHQVLPPHSNVENPLSELQEETCPTYLLKEPRPWLSRRNTPRRAGVSAFGFGGTNFHVVLEEYDKGTCAMTRPAASKWPCELFFLSAKETGSLKTGLERLRRIAVQKSPYFRMQDLAYSCAVLAKRDDPVRLAFTAIDFDDLSSTIDAVTANLDQGRTLPPNCFFSTEAFQGELAFLFPGQGSQYVGMGAELAMFCPEVRSSFEHMESLWKESPHGLTRFILPPAAFSEEERAGQASRLNRTDMAQPAIAMLSCGMMDLALRLGIRPARVAGHSFGEFPALHAAGVIDREDLFHLAVNRGRILADLGPDSGSMGTAMLAYSDLKPYLENFRDIEIANINSPGQVVLSGDSEQLEMVLEKLRKDGYAVKQLSVSAAFHSKYMSPAREPFRHFLENGISPGIPRYPVHANLDGAPYPQSPESIRERWVGHLENRVDFVSQIESMHKAGARLFLELGPGRVLSGLVRQILQDRPHIAIAADGGLSGWLKAVAQVFVHGFHVNPQALFEGRAVHWVDMDSPPPSSKKKYGWFMDGGRVWRSDDRKATPGKSPFIDINSPDNGSAVPSRALDLPAAQTSMADTDFIVRTYHDYQETMRGFLEQQERMITQILGKCDQPAFHALTADDPASRRTGITVSTEERKTVTEMPALSQPEEFNIDKTTLTQSIMTLVSERTGYPTDMLDPNMDLESELGVDSIKRIEILGRVQKLFPAGVTDIITEQFDTLLNRKSLNGLVEALVQILGLESPGQPAGSVCLSSKVSSLQSQTPEPGNTPKKGDASQTTCPRYIMRSEEKALMPVKRKTLEGLYLITEDATGMAEGVAADLRGLGAQAYLVRQKDLLDFKAIERRVSVLRQVHGPVRGVLHLTPFGLTDKHDEFDHWQQSTMLSVKAFFRLLQLCIPDFDEAGETFRIIAVSRLGGDWGRGSLVRTSPAAGGCHGMLRTLEVEYPDVLSKMVDFDDTMPMETIVQRIIEEFLQIEGDYEIGYLQGHRKVYSSIRENLDLDQSPRLWSPGKDWVVLVTGGARGITAEICKELAHAGARFILVGQSPLPPAAQVNKEEDEDKIRSQIISEWEQRNEKRHPDQIEAEVKERLKEAERWKNMEWLRENVAELKYHAVDVRSEEAFGALIDTIYNRYGRLDAVVHGAGIIEDRSIEYKLGTSFARVFDTKSDSSFILAKYLRPEGLKWVVFFSSVSGRYGNHGQIDYAAANEVVNRLACQLDVRWPDTKVLSINWGPWLGRGMAGENVHHLLKTKGISPVKPLDGRRFFVNELEYGRKGDVEVIAGDGPWKADTDQVLNSALEVCVLSLQLQGYTGYARRLS